MKSSSAKLRALFLGQVLGVTAAHPGPHQNVNTV